MCMYLKCSCWVSCRSCVALGFFLPRTYVISQRSATKDLFTCILNLAIMQSVCCPPNTTTILKRILLHRCLIWTRMGKHHVKTVLKKRWNSFLVNVFLLVRLWGGWPPTINLIFSESFGCITSLISSNPKQLFTQDEIQHYDISTYVCNWITNIQVEWSSVTPQNLLQCS